MTVSMRAFNDLRIKKKNKEVYVINFEQKINIYVLQIWQYHPG